MCAAGLTRSMSKKGFSRDNIACKGFFDRLKKEIFYGRSWVGVSMDEFINEINSYIEWYHTKQIKQSLGYMSSVEYRHTLWINCIKQSKRCPHSPASLFYETVPLVLQPYLREIHFSFSEDSRRASSIF